MDEIQHNIKRLADAGFAAEWNSGGAYIIDVEGTPPLRCPLCGGELQEGSYLGAGDASLTLITGCPTENIWWTTGNHWLN